MTPRIALALAAALLLSACTDQDWLHAMNAVGFAPKTRPVARQAANRAPAARPAATAPAPMEQLAPRNTFCEDVARQDSENNGFDAATQNCVFIRDYQQCLMVFGNAVPQ